MYGRQPEWFTLCNLVRTISRPACLIGLLLGRWLGWEANWYGMDFYFSTQAHTLPGAQPKMQPGSMVASTQAPSTTLVKNLPFQRCAHVSAMLKGCASSAPLPPFPSQPS